MSVNHTNELKDSIDAPATYTNRLLCQFGNVYVSPYALSFSRIAHTKYKPSATGERVFNSCITNLPVYVAADPNLQFGWNEDTIWRNLGLHQYEYEHLSLTAAIAECLPEDYTATVLSCLADKYEDNERPKPSLAAWAAIARSLNGMLTPSDFGLMIDDRMRLDPYRVTSGHSTSCTNSLIPPAQFAMALEALFNLSVTNTGELTLVGGNFLGWFAAWAELFLEINIQVTSRDGEVLYSRQTDSRALLRCTFVDDVNNLTPTVQSQASSVAVLTVMCGPDAEAKAIPRVPFTGRLGWEGVLPKVFENSFHQLAHQHSKFLVQSLGGMARYLAWWAEDPDTDEDIVSMENRRNPAAYGIGLIQTICNWFPELRHLQGRLEKIQALKTTAEIQEKCNGGAAGLVSICGCTICTLPDIYGKEDTGQLPQSFCPLAIMETIVNLGLAMSRITVVSRIYPSRAGILSIYQKQVQKLLYAKERVHLLKDCKSHDRIKTLFTRDWNANYSQRLQTAAAIFSGSWPEHDIPNNLVAISHEGICVNVLGVQYGDEKASRRKDAEVIRVQAGHIAWKQKNYTRACAGPPQGIANSDYTWERAKCDHVSQDLYFK